MVIPKRKMKFVKAEYMLATRAFFGGLESIARTNK